MAAAIVSAFEVSSIFINQYYRVLKESPEYSHQFYKDSSTLTRVDGDDTQTVSTLLDIHSLLNSLNVIGVEVTKLNCQDSWSAGILLTVSGFVRSRNFTGKRKFTQVFFLAPQEKGYFVLNDILQFNNEVLVNHHPVPEIPEIKVDSEVPASSPYLEQPASTYELEEETREYVNSLHIEEDNPVDKYSLSDEQQHEEPQSETVVKEAPVEASSLFEGVVNHVNHVEGSIPSPEDEPAVEPAKLSYASILRASKGQSPQRVVSQPTVRQSMPAPPEQHQRIQASAPQLNPSASSFVPETADAGTDEGLVQEGELTSVYVRSLPSNVTNADLEKEFKKFGKIKPNGVFIRNRKEIGVCFAFVEFEDMSGVHNAIKASPIELLGRQVFVEERRASSNSSSRGGVELPDLLPYFEAMFIGLGYGCRIKTPVQTCNRLEDSIEKLDAVIKLHHEAEAVTKMKQGDEVALETPVEEVSSLIVTTTIELEIMAFSSVPSSKAQSSCRNYPLAY